MLCDKLIDIYKKEYEQIFESKDEDWRKKHDFENLKDFSYQIDKAGKADVTEKGEDKTDQELPSWVKVTKSSFDEMKDFITMSNESGLVTKIGKAKIVLSDTKQLVEDIISGKIGKSEVRKIYNNIVDYANELNKLKATKPGKKCWLFLNSCNKFLCGLKQMMKQMIKQILKQINN